MTLNMYSLTCFLVSSVMLTSQSLSHNASLTQPVILTTPMPHPRTQEIGFSTPEPLESQSAG